MLKQFVNKMIEQGALKDNTGEVVTKSRPIEIFFKDKDTTLHDKEMYTTKFKEYIYSYSRPKMGRKRIKKTQQSSCVRNKKTNITETKNTKQIEPKILIATNKIQN